MTTQEQNKQIVRKMMTERTGILECAADDVRWTIPGDAKFCDTYKGKEDLLHRLLRPLGGLMATVGPFEIGTMIAEGDHVVVQARGTGRVTKSGQPYDNTYCIVCRLADGEVVEVDEYCDTELITRAFGPKE